MKHVLYLLPLAALLAMGSVSAANTYISTTSYSVMSASSTSAAATESSLFYTDGAGRLTNFEMTADKGTMTLRIRQDGAVVWSRTFAEKNTAFAVSRREENGRVYFLITAGTRHFTAEPNQKGEWTVLPVGEGQRAVAL